MVGDVINREVLADVPLGGFAHEWEFGELRLTSWDRCHRAERKADLCGPDLWNRGAVRVILGGDEVSLGPAMC